MRKREKIVVLLTLFLFLGAGLGWAEEKKAKEFEAYTLGEIVVSGDRVRETAVIAEITAEDIQATNSKTVAEALTYAPGVKVTVGRKNEPNVSIRNFDQSQALVLIDGVPYYETNAGKLDLNQIPTDNVARIEVIKGARLGSLRGQCPGRCDQHYYQTTLGKALYQRHDGIQRKQHLPSFGHPRHEKRDLELVAQCQFPGFGRLEPLR